MIKVVQQSNGESIIFSIKVVVTTGYPYKTNKIKYNPYLTLHVKINFRCCVNLNMKDKTVKFLEEIIEKGFYKLEVRKELLNKI